jgi:hypothetical protein
MLQAWIYDTVPWIISIPCQWFAGWLGDSLIRRGKFQKPNPRARKRRFSDEKLIDQLDTRDYFLKIILN